LELEQTDVKIAFLHRELKEKIYMRQPEDYIQVGKENKVCHLNKSLSRQFSRQWYKWFD